MWPWDQSSDAANWWGSFLTWASVVLALLAAFTSLGSTLATGAKDRFASEEQARLKEKIEPRRLDELERAALASRLTALKEVEVGVVWPMLDAEARQFAQDLILAVNAGGWTAVGFGNWTNPFGATGLRMGQLEGSPQNPAANVLRSALDAVSVAVEEATITGSETNTISPGFQPGFVYLLVGAKP